MPCFRHLIGAAKTARLRDEVAATRDSSDRRHAEVEAEMAELRKAAAAAHSEAAKEATMREGAQKAVVETAAEVIYGYPLRTLYRACHQHPFLYAAWY